MSITQALLSNESIARVAESNPFIQPEEIRTIQCLGIKVYIECTSEEGELAYEMVTCAFGFESTAETFTSSRILDVATELAATHILRAIRDGKATLVEVTA